MVVLVWPEGGEHAGEEQTWYAHRNCFVESLNANYRVLRDEPIAEYKARRMRIVRDDEEPTNV